MNDLKWIILGILIIFLCWQPGCTSTGMKRITSPDGTEYTSFVHREFLMRSKMKEAEVVVDGDYRHYAIGTRIQAPDPNGVRAITEGAVDAAVGL